MTDTIILASQSPRRKELLAVLGFKNFEIVPADIDEVLDNNMPIGDAVAEIALEKAEYVKNKVGDSTLILAADTVVVLDGIVLGKPVDVSDARRMLRSISGRTHLVYTGVALINKGRVLKKFETTKVSFRHLSDQEIDAYITTGEPMDKAGAYGAQGLASLFIDRIDGDYFNVVGLPLFLLGQMLSDMGFNIFK